mgnify:CR=1 FL=1
MHTSINFHSVNEITIEYSKISTSFVTELILRSENGSSRIVIFSNDKITVKEKTNEDL